MNALVKQHLIDPEICIRCHACEEACPKDAISHNSDNVVVDAGICDGDMSCIGPCPTGAIDNWLMVAAPHPLETQFEWMELPEAVTHSPVEAQPDPPARDATSTTKKRRPPKIPAPASASEPVINLHTPSRPVEVEVQGNYRLTGEGTEADIHHIILSLEGVDYPVLEGQHVGIALPGKDANGRSHAQRRYTISSPRDGERPGKGNISLTVRRIPGGLCSNYLCDLKRGDKIEITGPYGASFLMPNDPAARLIMICTGTGAAPFRAFTMRHQRVMPEVTGALHLFFGARSPDQLPYFGPLAKVPDSLLTKHFAFSRVEGAPKQYVQDKLREDADSIAPMFGQPTTHIYVCGLKAMEKDVEAALAEIAASTGQDWDKLRDEMTNSGRYHIETY
ncbi:MAG: benzoyl-CoA 2,3-epoxidase subunit BoxA [Rhodobacteraceae bacterium]|nr:benzoyl-CoA 2,3-epoxidase subunit BoxA [Paracoccaceae bacterium]